MLLLVQISLDLAWTANTEPDLSGYKVYRGTISGFAINFTSDIPIAQPTVNSYSDNDNLSASTTYYYRVVAVDTSGNIGELSDEGSATTAPVVGDTTPPSKVLGLAVGSITANSIDLSWTSNTEPDLDHYNVYRGTTAGFVVNSSTIPLAQSATNTTLTLVCLNRRLTTTKLLQSIHQGIKVMFLMKYLQLHLHKYSTM